MVGFLLSLGMIGDENAVGTYKMVAQWCVGKKKKKG